MGQPWKCPVCCKKAGSGTFVCVKCRQWTHSRCGGYEKKDLKNMDRSSLSCNNCKTSGLLHQDALCGKNAWLGTEEVSNSDSDCSSDEDISLSEESDYIVEEISSSDSEYEEPLKAKRRKQTASSTAHTLIQDPVANLSCFTHFEIPANSTSVYVQPQTEASDSLSSFGQIPTGNANSQSISTSASTLQPLAVNSTGVLFSPRASTEILTEASTPPPASAEILTGTSTPPLASAETPNESFNSSNNFCRNSNGSFNFC